MAAELLQAVQDLAKQVGVTRGEVQEDVTNLTQGVQTAIDAKSDPLDVLDALHTGQKRAHLAKYRRSQSYR